jgi:acyl-CoA thioesterase I
MKPIHKILLAIVILCLSGLLFSYFSKVGVEKNSSSQKAVPSIVKTYKIVAFGDSLTAGYNLPQNESYPAQLEAKLASADFSVQVINSGVSGETSRGNLERAEFIRSQNPNIVLLGIGGNDALRSLSVTDTKDNIEKTIQILQSGVNPPTVILLEIQAPLNNGLAYKKSFDALYGDLASTYSIKLIPFVVGKIFLDPSNMLDDGIHPNKKGYELIVDKYLFPAVTKELSKYGR